MPAYTPDAAGERLTLSLGEVCAKLGLPQARRMRRALKCDGLEPIKIAGHLVYAAVDVERYARERAALASADGKRRSRATAKARDAALISRLMS